MGSCRIDKYDGKVGGFRAKSAIAWVYNATEASNDLGKVWAVGLDANGKVVKGAGVSGIVGIVVLTEPKAINDVIDVMTAGEIADFTLQNASAAAAGTRYFGVAADGTFATTATGTPIGYTIEASRLVVRVVRVVALVTT